MRKSEEEQGAMLLHYGKSILVGGAAAFLICLAFLFVAAFCVSRGLVGAELRYQLAVVGCVLGSFAGGVFAVRRCPSRALLVGLAVGGVLFLLQLTAGLLTYNNVSLENGGAGLLCGALCGGAAAGILSGGGRRPVKSKKRRRG